MENAYMLLAQWRRRSQAMPAVYSKEKIDLILKEAMSKDYKHLVATLKKN